MSSLKCVRSLIPVDTFPACHPSKRLCPGRRQLSGMDGPTIGKSAAAKAAILNHIKDNQVVGIGSGTTIISAVKTLAERVSKENLKLVCIPTSFQARQLILEHKLTLGSLEQYPELDVAIDGADEIDKDLVCIKGGGGCLTQEKIVAYNAKEFIVCVEESKNVPELGTYWKKGIPLEVMPLAYRPLQLTIESKFGGHADLRMASRKMGPVVSDNGNFILDWRFDKASDWSKINNQLIHIPGIVETGIFTGMVTKAYIGSADGTVIVKDRNSNT